MSSMFKVYTGKLIGIENSLEDIPNRLNLSHGAILVIAAFSLLMFSLDVYNHGFSLGRHGVEAIITIGYFVFWYFCPRYAVICFLLSFLSYVGQYFDGSGVFRYGTQMFLAYKLAIPAILLIGIINVLYGHYQITNLQKLEDKHPDQVIHLRYVIDGVHVNNDIRLITDIHHNIDYTTDYSDHSLLVLKNGKEYYNFVCQHHAYHGKLCDVYAKKPLADIEDIIFQIIHAESMTDMRLLTIMLLTFFKEEQSKQIGSLSAEFLRKEYTAQDVDIPRVQLMYIDILKAELSKDSYVPVKELLKRIKA